MPDTSESASLVDERPSPPATSPATSPAPGLNARSADRVLAAVCVAAIAFFLLQILTYGYGRDQGIYSVVARTILEGGMPYRDAWDFKPPGIFLVFTAARALFGSAQYGIRVLEVLGLLAMIAGMTRLARDLWGERLIGLAAGALAAMVHAQLDFWHTAQPESFGGMLTIGALLLALSGERRSAAGDRRGAAFRWIASGVLFGAAGLLKPPLAGGGAVAAAVIGAHTYFVERRSSERSSARPPLFRFIAPALFIAAGGVLPIALCLAWFAAKGALPHLYQVLFVFTPHYTAIGWQGSSPIGMTYYGFAEWLTSYCSLITVGLLALVVVRPTPEQRYGVVFLAGVIVIQVIGVVMQGKFFPYHYGATWPVTAMIASLGLYHVWQRIGRRSAAYAALFFVGVVIAAFGRSATKDVPGSFLRRSYQRITLFTQSPRDQVAVDRLASVADVSAVTNRAVAEFLRARVPAGKPVFVWGFEPVIYDLADRPFSSPYIYNVAQRVAWAKGPAREALMRDLAAKPPAAIVVEHHDVFPMVTGDAIGSADALADFPALRDLINTRYELAVKIEAMDVYLERR